MSWVDLMVDYGFMCGVKMIEIVFHVNRVSIVCEKSGVLIALKIDRCNKTVPRKVVLGIWIRSMF